MAAIDNTHALPLPAHPMANPGFGKRSVPGQPRRTGRDFAHLAARDAYVAAYLDRLPDGAAIDVKTLAKTLPAYGQRAVRNALRSLSDAGHYRRVRERIGAGRPQWVHRSYFSRQARDESFWRSYLDGECGEGAVVLDTPEPLARTGEGGGAVLTPPPEPEPPVAAPVPPAVPASASQAYRVLAGLGRRDPQLVLSGAECARLEPLAGAWLTRGTTPEGLAHALTAGLPPRVFSAGALVGRRLRDKLPPEPAGDPAPPRREPVCGGCDRPASATPLTRGLCPRCRPKPAAASVRLHAAEIRDALIARREPAAPRTYRPRPAT